MLLLCSSAVLKIGLSQKWSVQLYIITHNVEVALQKMCRWQTKSWQKFKGTMMYIIFLLRWIAVHGTHHMHPESNKSIADFRLSTREGLCPCILTIPCLSAELHTPRIGSCCRHAVCCLLPGGRPWAAAAPYRVLMACHWAYSHSPAGG